MDNKNCTCLDDKEAIICTCLDDKEAIITYTPSGLSNQLEVRCPAFPEDCTYIRIIDKSNGEELIYWDHQEWIDDPIHTIGAIMGAFVSVSEGDIRSFRRKNNA